MKIRQTYICETCGAQSENKDEILLCEATHLGLKSVNEKEEYDYLLYKVRLWSGTVSKTNNDTTREALDEAITALMAFEIAHGMNVK